MRPLPVGWSECTHLSYVVLVRFHRWVWLSCRSSRTSLELPGYAPWALKSEANQKILFSIIQSKLDKGENCLGPSFSSQKPGYIMTVETLQEKRILSVQLFEPLWWWRLLLFTEFETHYLVNLVIQNMLGPLRSRLRMCFKNFLSKVCQRSE